MKAGKFLMVAVLSVALGGHAWGAAPAAMSVQVRNAQLRTTPSYLGKIAGGAAYAERVTILQTQGDWFQVQAASGPGWLHKSALSTKKIVAKVGASDVGATASGEELALSGKGFNADVEADFKQKNKNIDFAPIDAMEKISISPAESSAFLAQGGVKTAGGAP